MIIKHIKFVGEQINKFLIAGLLSTFFYIVFMPYKIFRKPLGLTWTKYNKKYNIKEFIHPW